jgi:hypothetical protein
MDIEKFKKDRREALLSMHLPTICAYGLSYGVELPKDEKTFWIAVHKARTGCLDLPLKERKKSKKWLDKRGYESFDDGEL